MAEHLVQCRYCKERFDAKIEEKDIVWIMPSTNFYYHKKCYDYWKNKKVRLVDHDWVPMIYDLLGREMKVSYNYHQIETQRKKVYIDTSPIDVDDDEYWKTGYYYNPDDKHILIENRMQSGNYTFNYAKKGAWIFTGITCAIIAGCIILVFVCMLPLINIQEKITLTNNNLTISAGGYTSEIDVNDITELKLLDELPDDSFLRTNGASTDSYDIGRYEGRTLGKCNLYVFDGYAPILMIKSDDTLVFVNSKEDGEIEKLYVELSQ